MKHLKSYSYPLIFAFLAISLSCQKENKTYPTVEILEPQEGSSYAFGDTIEVLAKITNRDGRAAVRVMQGSSVKDFEWQKIYDKGGEVRFRVFYHNAYIETGTYDLGVTAYNGENGSTDYISIELEELPLERTGLVVLSGSGGSVSLRKREESGEVKSVSLGGDHPYLAVNSRTGVIAAAPNFSGRLRGFNRDMQPLFEVPPPAVPGLEQYRSLISQGDLIYSYEEEGYIRGWAAGGEGQRNYAIENDREIVTAAFGEPGMLISAKERGKPTHELLLLNPVNGAVLKRSNIPGRAGSVAHAGQSIFVAAVVQNGNTLIYTYNISTNQAGEFAEITGEVPLCMLALGNGQILLSTDQQIYVFNPLSSGLPAVMHNLSAQDMEWDSVSGQVFYASGADVLTASPGMQPSLFYSAGEPIREMELLFNK